MSVHTGSCNELISIACRDGSTGAESYTITSTVADQMYYVYIAHYNASSTTTGDITISLDCAVVPECASPALTLVAQDAAGESIECLDAGSEFYVLATLSGGDGNNSYNVSANGGDATVVDAGGSVVFGPFAVGTDVDVTAVGVQDDLCSVTSTMDSPAICPPANDNCEGAEMLTDGVSTAGTVAAATGSGIPANTCDGWTGTANDDVFYMFTATTAEGNLVLEDDFDGIIELWEGNCGALAFISCKDLGDAPTIIFTDLTPGNVYYVRVFSYGSSQPITPTFSLTYTSVQTFDCPELEADFGDACDDSNEMTENDMINENCECVGTPIIVEPEFDCPNLEANIGDSCDDGNDMTENDVVTEDCECMGTPIEQNDMDGDGIPDDIDNCPSVYNPDQADGNGDGIGDACEECDLPYMVVLNRTSPTTATFNAGNSVWHYQGSANRAGRPLRPYPMYGMNDMTVPHTQYALVPAFDYDVWIRTICDDGSFSPWAGPFFLPTFETGARRTPRMDITPNPAIAIVKISKVEAKTIEVFDMNGGHVKTFNTNDNQFDMTGLPTGKYNLRVIDAEGNIHYDQVIKK